MRAVAFTCLALAVAGVAAAAIGYGMQPDPGCTDPPCGDTTDGLMIYGTYGAILFGVVGLFLGLVAVLVRRR